jgi:peroxiredoxin Q/BCP
MLELGQKVPDFKLLGQNDNPVLLKDFSGQWVVLYFYPKDNTSG